jgi:hypothetical protein
MPPPNQRDAMPARVNRQSATARPALALLTLAACLTIIAGCATRQPQPLINTVRWSTASESDVFGYDVYRSEQREGPFERITPQPIAGGGSTDLVRRYEFADECIEADTTYYYYVEQISLSGKREALTPVFQAPPKSAVRRPDDE